MGLTIAHMLLWAAVIGLRSVLPAGGGASVFGVGYRTIAAVLDWFVFILASPLFTLLAPRGFGSVVTDVFVIVANSFLVGYGLAGAIRKFAKGQFSLRSLFVLTTLAAVYLSVWDLDPGTRTHLYLGAATLVLLWLSLEHFPRIRAWARSFVASDDDQDPDKPLPRLGDDRWCRLPDGDSPDADNAER